MNTECWYYIEPNEELELGGCCKNKSEEWCDENCPIYKSMKNCFVKSKLEKKYWYPFNLKMVEKDKGVVSKIIEVRNGLNDFVKQGKNLLLQSANCGNGKTSWGIKLLQKQIELNALNSAYSAPPAFFVFVPSLLVEARKSISGNSRQLDKIEYMVENCPLIMFDEIGGIPLKDYDLLILTHLIEKRIQKGLSNIYTTNCQDEVLKVNLGDRLFDRVNRLSTVLTFKGSSMRGLNE